MEQRLLGTENNLESPERCIIKLNLAGESIAGSTSVVIGSLPSFTHYITEKATQVSNTYLNASKAFKASFLSYLRNVEYKDVESINFVTMSTSLITVPEGFSGSLTSYSDVCNRLYPELISMTQSYMNDLSIAISNIVTNRFAKLDTKSYENLYLKYKEVRLSSEKIINSFFDKSTKSRDTLGSVVSNKKELYDLFQNVKLLSNNIQTNTPELILAKVREVNELLNILYNQIKADPSIKFSSQVSHLLAEGTYEAGAFIEFISSFLYDCDVLIHVTQEISEMAIKLR